MASFDFSWNGGRLTVAIELQGRGLPVLLLPAMSTVSTRTEMRPVAERLVDRFQAISVDWPGFGEVPHQALDYGPDLMREFLGALLGRLADEHGIRSPAVVAAGHAAGYVLAREAATPGSFDRLALVAPTWRGPLPTMMGGRRPLQDRLRRLVQAPVVGPLLYRLNVSRPVVRRMYAGHVMADQATLTPAFLDRKLRVARQSGARFASAAFVTGALDPFADRDGFLEAAGAVRCPVLVLYGALTPPRSKAEMQALAQVAGVESVAIAGGKLGIHEEMPDAVAGPIRGFLEARTEEAGG